MMKPARVVLASLFLYLLLPVRVYAQSGYEKLLDNEWIEVRSKDIVIITDTDQKRAASFLSDLEKFRQVVFFILNIKPKDGIPPLTVYAFSHTDDFKMFVDRDDIGGYFFQWFMNDYAVVDLGGYHSTKRSNFARFALFHEFVHYVFRSYFLIRGIPRWFEEGFADFMSTTLLGNGNASVGMANEYRLYDISPGFDVASLFSTNGLPHSRRGAAKLYEHSYAVVHYLYTTPGYGEKISGYLDRLYKGESAQNAFESTFAISYDDFNREMYRYVKRNKFPYSKLDESRGLKLIEPEISAYRRVGKAEAAVHISNILYGKGFNEELRDKAFAMLNHATGLDNNLTKAWSQLALFHTYQGNFDDAKTALDNAVRLEPDSAWVNAVYGMWLFDLAYRQREEGNEDWINSAYDARRKYRFAIHKDRTSALAFAGLGDIYYELLRDDKDLAEGIISYNHAIYLSPFHTLIYRLAVLYVQNNEPDKAKSMLVHVIRDTEDERLTRDALQLLRKIDPAAAEAFAEESATATPN